MRLSHSTLACIVMLIVAACGGDNKSYQTAERVAVAPFAVPMYEGITDIMRDASFKTLPAGTPVYVTDMKATGNKIEYVKVVWGDSSAYVQEDFILQKGQIAVVIGPGPGNNIAMFDDKELAVTRMVIEDQWVLAAAIPTSESSTEIMYWYQGKPVRGFIPSDQVLTEASEVKLYNDYLNTNGRDERGMLLNTKEFADTKLAAYIMTVHEHEMANDEPVDERGDAETGEDYDGEDVYGEGGAPYGDTDDVYSDGSTREFFMADINWNREGKELTENEAPGEVKMSYVFEDDTDMPFIGYMAGGYAYSPDGTQLSEKAVKQIRVEFTPKKALTAHFQVDTWCITCEKYNTSFTDDLACSPAKTALTFIEDPDHQMVFCSNIRVIVQADGAERRIAISTDCGD